MYQGGPHPPLLSRRQSLETQYLTHRLQVQPGSTDVSQKCPPVEKNQVSSSAHQANVLANSPASCQLFSKETPRSLEQQLQEHR